MYKINNKNIQKSLYFPLAFCLVSIFFIALFSYVFFLGPIKKQSMDSTTEAKDIIVYQIGDDVFDRDELTYQAEYIYEVDGEEYICNRLFITSSRPDLGNKTVHYVSSNPGDCIPDEDASLSVYSIFLLLLLFIFIGSLISVVSYFKILRKRKYLAKHGDLFKNVEYRIENSNYTVRGKRVKKFIISVKLPNGNLINLESYPRFKDLLYDDDGKVDLLIDPNDLENYYIDLNIEKI